MVEVLKKGDEVIMQGGLIGKVIMVCDNELEVEIVLGVKICVVWLLIIGVVIKIVFVVVNS